MEKNVHVFVHYNVVKTKQKLKQNKKNRETSLPN